MDYAFEDLEENGKKCQSWRRWDVFSAIITSLNQRMVGDSCLP